MRGHCKACRYRLTDEDRNGVGQCRRYPPVVVAGQGTVFPETTDDEWCGEFRLEPPTAVGERQKRLYRELTQKRREREDGVMTRLFGNYMVGKDD